jgi:glycosyltransferase involved in cell wall biosynthesis
MNIARKIRIVHLTQCLDVGGLETFIMDFCRMLDNDRFHSSVLCLNGFDNRFRDNLAHDGVAVDLVRKNFRFDLLFLLRGARLLRQQGADVVHLHGGCLFYGALMAKLAGVKGVIYTVHGMPVTSGLQARVEEFLSCLMLDRIVAVSHETAEDLKSRQKRFVDKVDLILNGIDTNKYRPLTDAAELVQRKTRLGLPLGRKIIGSVGRLEKVKNYGLLLRAVAELTHGYGDDFHLAMAGSGREEHSLRELARELGIEQRVSFLGMQYDMHRIYPLFDVFVLPSLTEGTSISLLEAQSCGIPAVVTDVGGNSRIVKHGDNGFLCPSGDHATMSATLHRLLNSDQDLIAMSRSARGVILGKFDIYSVLRQYQHIYQDCLGVPCLSLEGCP